MAAAPADQSWDVLIVGAGPAGSTAAALLAQQKWRVLLVDKMPFPRPKVCGGCLNAAAIGLLHQAGLAAVLAEAPALTHLEIHSASAHIALPIPPGMAVERRLFDARLVAAAQERGAHFLAPCQAQLLPATSAAGREILLTHHGTSFRCTAPLILACDGVAGSFLRHESWARWQPAPHSAIGLATTLPDDAFPAHTIGMIVGTRGYVGLVRHSPSVLHLGAALDPAACRRCGGPARLLAEILSALPTTHPLGHLAAHLSAATAFLGTPFTGRRRSVAGAHILAVGDACGYVEPFTGEGIAWALRGATQVAALLTRHGPHYSPALAAAWKHIQHTQIVHRQRWCRRLRPIVRRPPLTAISLAVARRVPWLATMIVRRINT